MSSLDFLTPFASILLDIVAPLQDMLASPAKLADLLKREGWRLPSNGDWFTPLSAALSLTGDVEKVASELTDITEGSPSIDELNVALDSASKLLSDLRAVRRPSGLQLPAPLNRDDFWSNFPIDLAEDLVVMYLERAHPVIYAPLRLLGILDEVAVKPPSGDDARLPYLKQQIRWDRLATMIGDLGSLPHDVYGWGGAFAYGKLLFRLENVLHAFGLLVGRHQPVGELSRRYYNDKPPNDLRLLHLTLVREQSKAGGVEMGLVTLPIPVAAGGPPTGLFIGPYVLGAAGTEFLLDGPFSLKLGGGLESTGLVGIEVSPGKVSPLLDSAAAKLALSMALVGKPPSPWILIGDAHTNRLELADFTLALDLVGNIQDPELKLRLHSNAVRLVLDPSESDSFLQDIFGDQPQTNSLGGDLVWSSKSGLSFSGQGSLQLIVPIHQAFGPAHIDEATISLGSQNSIVRLTLGLSGGGQLGPFVVIVQNMGLALNLTPVQAPTRGAFGDLDLDFGFKPPDGVGLAIEGGGFTGGGFLSHNPADQSYEGMLELAYEDRISLKAIGLITTHLPGGQSGFSLLILITAEFTPIQLGLGFTLNGVGGLIGLNRSAMVERLRSGLRDGTLNSILFPQNIIANAARILSDLRQVFPPTQDQFIFGPMARIGWGTPTLLTIDLGLILELPNPVRLLILGVLRMALPKEDEVILQLQVNFLGVIDFNAGTLAFDASLFDSHLLGLTLSGDMAVRAKWSGKKNLLLSVGGFNPLFQPPPLNLPTLRRITVQLLSGNNPRLTLETYFAVTSNTLQFGAKVDLYASAGSFAVSGHLGFDALFHRKPFYFTATFAAQLDLLAGSSRIAGIRLSLTLEGPTPYHAHGTAHLEICWFLDISVSFDHTWGETRNTRLDPVAVLPLLQAALSDPGNWQTSLPAGKNLLVTYKKTDPAIGLLLAPAGVLTIAQQVVPLDVDIQTFGAQQPADASRFQIQQVSTVVEGQIQPLSQSPVQGDFAPAQFFQRSDSDKLTVKSFEQYDAGVRVDDSAELRADYTVPRAVAYDLFYKDPQRNLVQDLHPRPVDVGFFEAYAVGGAVAHSPLSQARRGQPAGLPGAVGVIQEPYAVVRSQDLTAVQDGQVFGSEAEALVQLGQLLRQQPNLAGEIQVIPAYEVK